MLRVYVSSLALLFALGSFGLGQSLPILPVSSDQVVPGTTQSDNKDQQGTKETDVILPVRQEHIIYLPFKNLPDVFERGDSSIVLPYKQFLDMWNRLAQPDKKPIKPPVNGVITRADYIGSIKGDLVYIDATLNVEVLSEEWARLPVQFGDAAIGSAQAKDKSVLLRGIGEGRYELLVRGKGKHQIKLKLVTRVESDAEGRRFTVQCPAVGVSNLELRLPEKDLVVQVKPQRTSELRSGSGDATRVIAVLGATNQFTVSWRPKAGSSDKVSGLANVYDTIAIDVGDGVVHTHAVFNYQILRGALDEVVLEMPTDQRILDVKAPGLRDWKTKTVENRQRVTVRLHAPVTEKICLELHAESPISEQAFQVGDIRAVGVARESGIMAVRNAEDVGLEYVESKSITRIDAVDVPKKLRKPRSTFYKFFTPNHELSVVASRLEPRIVVDSHLSILLSKTRLTTRGKFKYRISRSGVFALAFRLPRGFQIDDVRTESMERFEIASAGDTQTLTVYFTKKVLGDLTVKVTASQSRYKPSGELSLPLLEPLHFTREHGLVAVIAPESLEVKTESGRLRAALAATPAELASKGFEPKVPEDSTLAAAFSFVTRPVSIVQTITERPRRTFALVGTAVNVKEDVVQVATTFRYKIRFAGTSKFRLAVPAAVSDRLQIEGKGIKERLRSKQVSENGTVEWTIVLHSEILGQFTFTATYDQTISIPDKGIQFELQPIEVLDADREAGEVAIQKDRALSVEAIPTGLEEIDPRELSQSIDTKQPYLTYRYYQHPARLTLSVTKYELQDVVKTVVRRAYIEAVVTDEGPMTVRARYELKSSERQRLAVTLRNPRILGITVSGQTVAPEKSPATTNGNSEDKTYLINVARTADSDEPFQIQAVFEIPRPKKELKMTDILNISLPRFDKNVKFQKVYVRIWVPNDYRLVGNPYGFTSHIGIGFWDSRKITRAPDNPDSWFSKNTSSFDFQVGGTPYLFSSMNAPKELTIRYWHIPTMTTIASLIVLAIGFILLQFSLETKVFTFLVLALIVLFISLFSPSFMNSWLLAARPGIAGVVAIWLISWLLYVRRTRSYLQWFATSSPLMPDDLPKSANLLDAELVDGGASKTDQPERTEVSDGEDTAGETERGSDE